MKMRLTIPAEAPETGEFVLVGDFIPSFYGSREREEPPYPADFEVTEVRHRAAPDAPETVVLHMKSPVSRWDYWMEYHCFAGEQGHEALVDLAEAAFNSARPSGIPEGYEREAEPSPLPAP